ncbi:MAG: 4-(cytidine 5'-diphospho)-2-C-methyl-D-erythritol kinase [Chitinophagaceae bacterium]|nr:4-(cytidine 5'-diphospho)-2-C-methyl-D-erythritol kinase [Chitinophagaceae bacterium]
MLVFPNAKINIGLQIGSKRSDGYHNIKSVFYPISTCDILEFIPDLETNLTVYGNSIEGKMEDNLVYKAYLLLQKDFYKIKPGIIHLFKNIPSGAGLGGGSADASFMLKLLSDFFKLDIEPKQLEKYALILGSDCPFFIENKPKLISGRGEIMEDIELNLSKYNIQLICPNIHISTKEAYNNINRNKQIEFNFNEILSLPITDWKNWLKNDFEDYVFAKAPAVKKIKDQLYHQGALYASMSGSGSSVYGIFPKNKKANIDIDIDFKEFIC